MTSNVIADLREECTVLRAQLAASEKADDEILRQDIARIAAKMLALTANTEGDASPIPALLAKTADDGASCSKLIAMLSEIAPDLLGRTGLSGKDADPQI